MKQEQFATLQALGVKDSKTLSDGMIQKIAKGIKKECLYHIVKINPQKYNELYKQFGNLNRLLAWGHATTIEQLVLKTNCPNIIIDQFADDHVAHEGRPRRKEDDEVRP